MKNFENTELHIAAAGLYDLSLLEEMEDNEYTLDVLGAFIEETPAELKEMQSALQQGVIDTVCKKAHKIKSSAAVIQADHLTTLLKDIEDAGRRGAGSNTLSPLVEQAIQQYKQIEKALQAHMQLLK
ncbi:Hpt domain-containing protein [Ferruginibacter sp.]